MTVLCFAELRASRLGGKKKKKKEKKVSAVQVTELAVPNASVCPLLFLVLTPFTSVAPPARSVSASLSSAAADAASSLSSSARARAL